MAYLIYRMIPVPYKYNKTDGFKSNRRNIVTLSDCYRLSNSYTLPTNIGLNIFQPDENWY